MKEKVIISIIASLVTSAIIYLAASFQSETIVKLLGGATADQITAIHGRIDEIQSRTQFIQVSERDEATHIKAGSFQYSFHNDGNFRVYDAAGNVIPLRVE
ncbi:MAG: hypothetical protein AAGD01_08085 [Acidobacteriota bacterium]